ncbi:hypothetical protein TCAL_10660 [Tigriopus californicus]|uniref:Uncharacterized protein n=1 Tax=Tigriopus californicus TaxID=6832 RepID=A0A553PKX7_TIGCA|nr:thyroid adenoma-associated protein homolog [Tigriopus californicus]TRY78337.1 hypothetical protein TCAL_10660 [Tigriopus californicus]|eukprot:TCALIF_10660-PA protein Name:"Similar to Thada Thyroid adenoma-associated protein homolog (Mus musculus)" AED:0.05 eAED:0.05 QI:65/1/0.75/1/1/1/4/0/1611
MAWTDTLEHAYTRELRQWARQSRNAPADDPDLTTFYRQHVLQAHGQDPFRPYAVLQAWDYCPPVRARLIEDRTLILPQVWRNLRQWATLDHPSAQMDTRDILACLKEAALLSDVHDLAAVPDLTRLLFSIMEHQSGENDVSLVAATTLVKITMKQTQNTPDLLPQICLDLFHRAENGFSQVCLAEGIMNAGPPELLLQNEGLLLNVIFPFVINMCSQVTSYQFQSFQSLRILTQTMLDCSQMEGHVVPLQVEFGCDSLKTSQIMSLLSTNWENPLKGVSDLLLVVYHNVIRILQTVDEPREVKQFLEGHLNRTMSSLLWKNRAKYPVLLVLVQFMKVETILVQYPDLPRGLTESLSITHLVSIGATLYKAILKRISQETWMTHFQTTFIECLSSHDQLMLTNMKNQWMLPTIQFLIPSNVQHVIQKLEHSQDFNASKLSGILCIFKNQRQLGQLNELSKWHYGLVQSGLVHANHQVRNLALSVICNVKKRGIPPNAKDMELISKFVNSNLTVDSASFRQIMMSDLTILLTRVHDFLAMKSRKKSLADDEAQEMIRNVQGLLSSVFANCFPGANYQRLISCLEIMGIFLSLFQDMDFFAFYSRPRFEILLSCASYYMTDVRDLAKQLLEGFHPEIQDMKLVLERALVLVSSPKFSETESGACLLHLVGQWTCMKPGLLGDIYEQAKLPNDVIPKVSSYKNVFDLLLNMYKSLLEKSEETFLTVAKHCPMHGLLTGIRFGLSDVAGQMSSEFVSDLVATLQKSVGIMLATLSHDSSNSNVSPSFAEMDEAIEELIQAQEESVEISVDHQLVLACAWLNLKECSLLAGTLVKTCSKLDIPSISKCGAILTSVLTRCRHKGAMEATMSASSDYFQTLLSAGNPELNQIPLEILVKTLNQIEDYPASITRRSAGLPMLIAKIVVSEPKGRTRKLLGLAVDRLVGMTQVKELNVVHETKDQVQSHALHILRSLAHDSALSQDILEYVPQILRCCLDQFESPHWSVRNATLQLFGSLAPRILGQKKVRSEECISNSINVSEFLSRFSSIIQFILDKLLQPAPKLALVNPVLVPLLSLLSKISPCELTSAHTTKTAMQFRHAFYRHLSSPVINVRKLAAKSFASFTAPSQLEKEIVSRIQTLGSNFKLKTNFRNGLLLNLKAMIQLVLLELQVCSKGRLGELLVPLAKISQLEPCCYINRNLIGDICDVVQLDYLPHDDLGKQFDPGYLEWKGKCQAENKEVCSNQDFLNAVQSRQGDPKKVVDYLTDNLDHPHLNGQALILCHEIIHHHQENFIPDPEAALDLLDLVTDERLTTQDWGLTAQTSLLLASSTAFTAMMVQEDFNMFFRDDSVYVSHFMEFSEQILKFSQPRNMETSRFNSASAILNLLPMFNQRDLKSDVPLVMQYGFVNILNACFTLLVDEESSVRGLITDFVSNLTYEKQPVAEPSLSQYYSIEKLVFYGLDGFPDCSEWFQPIIDVYFLPWRENNSQMLEGSLNRRYLFESGEGVNVFSEEVALNIVYFNCLIEWLAGGNQLRLNLDVGRIVGEAQALSAYLPCNEEGLRCFSACWTHPGYLILTRLVNVLKIWEQHPMLENVSGVERNCIRKYLNDLQWWVMHEQ